MEKIKITLVKSVIGRPKDQKATVFALGIRKMHQTVEKTANPQILGMVKKVAHLLKIIEE
jgi:large subunit ribosomal protein L30